MPRPEITAGVASVHSGTFITEEDGRHYVLFYNDADELVAKREIHQTVEECLEKNRKN